MGNEDFAMFINGLQVQVFKQDNFCAIATCYNIMTYKYAAAKNVGIWAG